MKKKQYVYAETFLKILAFESYIVTSFSPEKCFPNISKLIYLFSLKKKIIKRGVLCKLSRYTKMLKKIKSFS